MISTRPFGFFGDKPVTLYTMRNNNSMEISVINYGGIIVTIKVPDKNGKIDDVTLGFDSLSDYVISNPFFGALIGRYGNRVAGGKFSLDNIEYTLPVNNDINHLHGGSGGFDKVYWDIQDVSDSRQAMLKLSYLSKDGEEGYPGNVGVEIVYTLTPENEIKINYRATTDKTTIINLTQHSYFNLGGHASSDILDHQLTINADYFLPVDESSIPTGSLQSVKGTAFDFLFSQKIGSLIHHNEVQLSFGKGYDHCWALNNKGKFEKVATLHDPASGRLLEVFTDQPGLQFYSGNSLDGSHIGKNGVAYKFRQGLCLETQHFPDTPNQPSFPSVTLNTNEIYETMTVYKFSIK
jgi:aldose 1-epimerase